MYTRISGSSRRKAASIDMMSTQSWNSRAMTIIMYVNEGHTQERMNPQFLSLTYTSVGSVRSAFRLRSRMFGFATDYINEKILDFGPNLHWGSRASFRWTVEARPKTIYPTTIRSTSNTKNQEFSRKRRAEFYGLLPIFFRDVRFLSYGRSSSGHSACALHCLQFTLLNRTENFRLLLLSSMRSRSMLIFVLNTESCENCCLTLWIS